MKNDFMLMGPSSEPKEIKQALCSAMRDQSRIRNIRLIWTYLP
jgi:hypothetical protein